MDILRKILKCKRRWVIAHEERQDLVVVGQGRPMMKRGEREYVLGAGRKDVLTGLRYQGIVLGSRAVVGKAGEAVRSGQVIFAYGGVSGDGACEPGHILHVILRKVHEEMLGVLVF